MRPLLVCLLAGLTLSPCLAQEQLATVQPTAQLLSQAEAQAAAEHKNIIVLFTASWCGPCHMLNSFFTDKKVAPVIDQGFITVRLDVGERDGDTRHTNTPGAEKLMTTLAGDRAGYPFFAVLDPTGKPIVDSNRPDGSKKDNIGYPQTAPQIDWFLHMIQTSYPAINKKQFSIVREGILDQSARYPRTKSVEFR